MSKKQLVFIILTLSWMVIIFSFSSKNSDDSTVQSNNLGYFIANIFVPDFDSLSEAEKIQIVESIDHPIRKCAHATEYAILGFLITGCLSTNQKSKYRIIIAEVISALYATSDEIHQLFVPGRSCQFKDIIIDSSGALIGILLYFIVSYLIIKCILHSSQDNA